jgi:2'-5' RNA ligase
VHRLLQSNTIMRKLSHRSALVLLPPSTITAPIEAVRCIHDKQFLRWPPHINLLYPFLESPSRSVGNLRNDISMRIEKVTHAIKPFRISLSSYPPGIFHHSQKNKTIWLDPATQHLYRLQAALRSEFFRIEPARSRFRPHLTVGKATSQDGADAICTEITKSISEFLAQNADKDDNSTALGWLVDQVHVLERKDEIERFKIVGTIPLGRSSASVKKVTTSAS